MNDNAPEAPALSDEEIVRRNERIAKAAQEQVKMLMNELKKIFHPEMRLTFIARHPDDDTMYSFLTEETKLEDLVRFLQIASPPMLIQGAGSDAIN